MHLVLARKMLGEQVGGIDLAPDLLQLNCLGPHLLLHPKGVSLKVSKLA